MFEESIEAWANGPVVPELYDRHRGDYLVNESQFGGNPKLLSQESKETCHAVMNYYGDKSPQWLSDLTHAEQPWISARSGLQVGQRGSAEISLASMEEYYSSLRPTD